MQLASVFLPSLLLLVLFLTTTTPSNAHNITRLLAKHPDFSTFNHYLTTTHLAAEINSRTTITILVVDNVVMSDLLSKHPSIYTIKNILSLHTLLDYFGTKKLHQITNGTALAATMFQVNKVLSSTVAEAPTPGPSQINLTGITSAHGCKVFADTLLANPEVSKTYQDNMDGGLTVFCPLDDPFKLFMPRFKNLTMQQTNNGLMNTLATDGANKYDFTVQNDGDQPLAIYTIDKVLLPNESFKDATDTPKASKDASSSPSDSPVDAPGVDSAVDQTADGNNGMSVDGGRSVAMAMSVLLGLLMCLL
ncbi:hypothetical protein K2173_008606 [Erythroxylum novogranatense]|uniref:FAS1 domain-containing protein n=1 Tax=Erythroxylum novogranatense TaxID=1862640 RepID=A0AAV8SKR1_9ROSI|nr:hypothetical protein K2173_008606 [Erythroxylum novogranatense]